MSAFDPESGDEERDHRQLPVFKKAEEIVKIVMTLSEIIDKDKDQLRMAEQMIANAIIIPAKIAGAEGGGLYNIRFDNAPLIKLAAREPQAQTSMVREEKLCDEKYITLLRESIEEFRILFLEWVSSFDKENDIEDEWDIKKH